MAAPESQATLTAPESGCQASVADSTTPDYACRCRFPKATFARFQPHSSSFLDITDHGMMLHNTLENFAALTAGSTVRVTDGKRTHLLDVLDVEGARHTLALTPTLTPTLTPAPNPNQASRCRRA